MGPIRIYPNKDDPLSDISAEMISNRPDTASVLGCPCTRSPQRWTADRLGSPFNLPIMSSDLIHLAKLISDSTSAIVKAAEFDNVPIPNLNDPFSFESEAFRNNPSSRDAANIIIAAAAQLSALVAPPPMSIFNIVSGVSTVTPSTILIDLTSIQHFRSAALRVCLELNVTEILREAGPQV